MKKTFTKITAFIAVFLLAMVVGNTADQKLIVTKWTIEGMTCNQCASGLESGLSSVTGILSCDVDYASKSMVCELDENVLAPSEITELVSKLGYKAIPLSSDSAARQSSTTLQTVSNKIGCSMKQGLNRGGCCSVKGGI